MRINFTNVSTRRKVVEFRWDTQNTQTLPYKEYWEYIHKRDHVETAHTDRRLTRRIRDAAHSESFSTLYRTLQPSSQGKLESRPTVTRLSLGCLVLVLGFFFGKENNSSRRVTLKIELELNNLNTILSRSAVTPVFPLPTNPTSTLEILMPTLPKN